MGLLEDVLKEVPLSAVLKERIALAEDKVIRANEEINRLSQRVAELEKENATLQALVPRARSGNQLSEDTRRVLILLFKTEEMDDRDVGALARSLKMERSVLQYHLDELDERGFAEMAGGNYLHGHVYWALTAAGRRYVVENKVC